jgi:hypothetical protein
MALRQLRELAFARSGDKGDISNICLYARKPEYYPLLKEKVTAQKVKEHFAELVTGQVDRYEVDTLEGMNFVLHGALDGGATQSSRLDTLGKSMAAALLRMYVDDGHAPA